MVQVMVLVCDGQQSRCILHSSTKIYGRGRLMKFTKSCGVIYPLLNTVHVCTRRSIHLCVWYASFARMFKIIHLEEMVIFRATSTRLLTHPVKFLSDGKYVFQYVVRKITYSVYEAVALERSNSSNSTSFIIGHTQSQSWRYKNTSIQTDHCFLHTASLPKKIKK